MQWQYEAILRNVEDSKMNIENRIKKLEEVGVKIAEQQGNLARAAKALGMTVEGYKVLVRNIASLPDDELVKLSEMVEEKMNES